MATQPSLTPAAFAAKWHGVTTTEKASAQEHFIDLCRMLGEPTPHEADPIGAQYAFEKRVLTVHVAVDEVYGQGPWRRAGDGGRAD